MNEFWRQMIASIKSMSSPMRPERAEVAILEHAVAARQASLGGATGTALLLGVTEEIVGMDWPAEVFLEAVDRSQSMIDAFWMGDLPERRRLRQANWWEMDSGFGPYRFAIGDGVFNLQAYPTEFRAFASKLHSVMEPGGLGLFRVFSYPEEAYSPADVIMQFESGALDQFQQLRFCLAIARQASAEQGSALNIPQAVDCLEALGIGKAVLEALPDFASVARPMLETPNPHSLKLYYPTRDEFQAAVQPWFEVHEVAYGEQPLANLCPTYILSARENAEC